MSKTTQDKGCHNCNFHCMNHKSCDVDGICKQGEKWQEIPDPLSVFKIADKSPIEEGKHNKGRRCKGIGFVSQSDKQETIKDKIKPFISDEESVVSRMIREDKAPIESEEPTEKQFAELEEYFNIKHKDGIDNSIPPNEDKNSPAIEPQKQEEVVKALSGEKIEDVHTFTSTEYQQLATPDSAVTDNRYYNFPFQQPATPVSACNHVIGANDNSGICIKCGKKVCEIINNDLCKK